MRLQKVDTFISIDLQERRAVDEALILLFTILLSRKERIVNVTFPEDKFLQRYMNNNSVISVEDKILGRKSQWDKRIMCFIKEHKGHCACL